MGSIRAAWIALLLAGCCGPHPGGIYFSHSGYDGHDPPARDAAPPGPISVTAYNRGEDSVWCEWSGGGAGGGVADIEKGDSLGFGLSCQLVVSCRNEDGDELFLRVFATSCGA